MKQSDRWELAAQAAALDYQNSLGRAAFLAQQILKGHWMVDTKDRETVAEIQGLHRALDHHSDAWARHRIAPPCKLSGDEIHLLKVRLRGWMQEKEINTVPALETDAIAA